MSHLPLCYPGLGVLYLNKGRVSALSAGIQVGGRSAGVAAGPWGLPGFGRTPCHSPRPLLSRHQAPTQRPGAAAPARESLALLKVSGASGESLPFFLAAEHHSAPRLPRAESPRQCRAAGCWARAGDGGDLTWRPSTTAPPVTAPPPARGSTEQQSHREARPKSG